jgi:hypothetical protein
MEHGSLSSSCLSADLAGLTLSKVPARRVAIKQFLSCAFQKPRREFQFLLVPGERSRLISDVFQYLSPQTKTMLNGPQLSIGVQVAKADAPP